MAGRSWRLRAHPAIERLLEAERGQLPLWLPVLLGCGIATWFVLPTPRDWMVALLISSGIAVGAWLLPAGGRLARVVSIGAAMFALGLALVWARAERVGAPIIARPGVFVVEGQVERIEPQPARGLVRLSVATADAVDLPPRIRVNLSERDMPGRLSVGSAIRLRARLLPPPAAAVPGAYDFQRVAWFAGIGATGRGFAPVEVVQEAGKAGDAMRARLSLHIQSRIDGTKGGIATALATGDRGGIDDADAEALRRSGLAHLLSISGLHVTAVVGATMLLVLKLLALSPMLALRIRLPIVAAGAGALAAIGYTWLSGGEVPTLRSCIAALLVLAALAMGREAITLRLVATGALVVLVIFPEALVGPRFQLSFAAVTAIVALHEHPAARRWFGRGEGDGAAMRLMRGFGTLLATGLAVEIALMPIGLYHFHKAGLYGALANIVAIPLTTFVTMPFEAGALLLDAVGLGAPLWWVVDASLAMLLWIAHRTAEAPGAVAALPAMPIGAFGLIVAGELWIALWRMRWRWVGLLPILIGAGWTLATPAPDLLVTGDGRHLALRTVDGGLAMLRDRSGDYALATLAENGGVDGMLGVLAEQPDARCSADLCIARHRAGERVWTILATRSAYLVPAAELIGACRRADIVVSERRLPVACRPRWLKLDRATLARTGGVAIAFDPLRVETTARPGAKHPWRVPDTVAPPRRADAR